MRCGQSNENKGKKTQIQMELPKFLVIKCDLVQPSKSMGKKFIARKTQQTQYEYLNNLISVVPNIDI